MNTATLNHDVVADAFLEELEKIAQLGTMAARLPGMAAAAPGAVGQWFKGMAGNLTKRVQTIRGAAPTTARKTLGEESLMRAGPESLAQATKSIGASPHFTRSAGYKPSPAVQAEWGHYLNAQQVARPATGKGLAYVRQLEPNVGLGRRVATQAAPSQAARAVPQHRANIQGGLTMVNPALAAGKKPLAGRATDALRRRGASPGEIARLRLLATGR